ncbi:ecto-ADP-ribosyltransferase 5 [Anoplopoma fimbria]|uniref:ecto-ADP-ribosyltransferase 5 n=1 Tax=Anoplopoma fimbria TaxID=229290 RepID=UPI0023EB9276|nr:ecto-ADP-ribosyltransferase 5 [Anoplopoma fimbria]
MWDTRKLLLTAIVFYYKMTVGSAKLMDMAPDAVDYTYNGCRKEAMEKFINLGLLRQELNNNEEFQKAWDHASTDCLKLIPGGTKEHTAALLAYADGTETFTKMFDNAVETMGGNVSIYDNDFHFKSLHFLLMDSMLLRSTRQCKTLHIVQETKWEAKKGSKVKFGKFTKVYSSYSEVKEMEDLAGLFVFNITSCFFVNLGNICRQEGKALLSPAEVFTVEAVVSIADEINESDHTEIVLKHSELDTSDNCYSLSGSPADVSAQWLVLMLVPLSHFFFNY